MDSLNEFCPTPKRLKPMEPESIACGWDAVNANDLNAELPEELRDISSNECFQSFGNQGIRVPYFQSDYFSLQLPNVEHEGPINRLQVTLPFAGQQLNSNQSVNLLYSKDVKSDELSGHSTFPSECTNILQRSMGSVIYSQPAIDVKRDFKLLSSTSLIPQKFESERQLTMTPLIFQMQQSSQTTFASSQNDSNYFLVQSGTQKLKTTLPQTLPSDENKPIDVPLESSLVQNRCLIQKQLILLLHANKCQKGRDGFQSAGSFCNIPQCQTMKDVLKHLADCKEDNCTFSYCASSRQIIKHWKQCSNNQCAVCQPLKLACEKKNASLLSKNLTTASTLPPRSSFVRLGDSAGLPTNTYSLGINLRSTAVGTSSQCLENVGKDVNLNIFPSDKNDWHQSFGKEMRDSVVYKLMKCLYPSCGSLSLNELTNIILSIKKLESGVFEKASSKEEYYNILSAKIQAIKIDSDKQQRETSKIFLQKSTHEIQTSSPFLRVADTQFKSKTQGVARETGGDLREMPLSNYDTSTGCTSDSTISTKLVSFSKEMSYSEELNPNGGVSSSLSIQEAVKTTKEATDSLVGSSSDITVSTSSNFKVWRKDELRSFLLPILMELYRTEPESLPFRQPVDPVLEGVPEYLEVIKKPMDLSTIKNKLENGAYDQPWAFIDDMWQIFENAWMFNKKGSRVHRYCTKLSEIFDPLVNVLMKKLGYCCGHKYMYTPIVLVCYGKYMCNIPINTVYYTYQNRFSYCENCFNSIPGDFIDLNEEPGQSTRLMKSYFVKMKNGEFEYEKLIECPSCGKKQHPVCCMHLEQFRSGSLKCPSCTKDESISGGIENKYSAKKLPQTYLSSYLESRVNLFIKKSGCDFREVVIRVLSCSEKNIEVKQGMRKAYFKENKNDVAQFPYVSKAIFAFMEDGGAEVCFFGMHVHEYDSSCPHPNSRRVYIAYMDSVNFFHPRHLRTSVYHELLIGYLDYVKKIGYAHAHIWVCPPSEGDDYIFNCHPPNMRIPKQKRLQDWYKKLLDKALSENVIYGYKDLLRDLKDRSVTSVTEIPYFDGDYWPSILEEYLKESEEFEAQICRNDDCYDDIDYFEVESEGSSKMTELEAKKKFQKGIDGKKKKVRNKPLRRQPKKASGEFRDVMTRVVASLEKLKEGFFVVNLHPPESEGSLPEIKDPDQCMLNDLMDGRDSFLTLAREKHFEFSSLRRAKHSTMALLYELHTHGKINFTYSCNACKAIIDNHYHCNVCPDFDLCETCYNLEGHEHAMERFMEIYDKKCEENISVTSRNSKNAAMAREMALLIHVFQCQNVMCQTSGCQKMKSILHHVKACKLKNEKTCTTCRHFLALCCCHAKRCSNANCFIPLCEAIKQRFLLQKKLQGKMLKRRMASLRRDVGFSHDYYGTLSSDTHKDQSLANPLSTDRVDFQHKSSFNGNKIKKLPDKETTKDLTTSSSQMHRNNAVNAPETSDGNYIASNVTTQIETPSPHAMLLINPNLSTVRVGNQVMNSTNPTRPIRLQLQSNHCLLTNAQGEILGVVQMPTIQNQHLVNINPSQASQTITSSISSSQTSNMAAMSKSSNLSEEYLSHFQTQVNQGGLQQLEAERSKGEKSVMTHASRSSTSALLTLYKTLKSSPLQQHQQLLNILMNDPLKLAKVIKQKQANKRDAQKSFLSTSSSSIPTLPKLVTISTVSNLSTSGYINSQIHLETQPPLSSATCTIPYYPSKNEICEQTSLGQHSHNLIFAPANVIPSLNSSLLQGRKLSNSFEVSEKIIEPHCFGNKFTIENKIHQVGVQPQTVIPSMSPLSSTMTNDNLEVISFTEIPTPQKSSDIQQFHKIVHQDSSFNLQEVLNQKSLAKRFPEQKSQRCVSVSSDVIEKLLIMKELQPQATSLPASQLDKRPVKSFSSVKSNPAASHVGNVTEHHPSSTWIKNVMLSSQFPCNIEILCDNSSFEKQSEDSQMIDGSLQDQLSRYAEEL